jgi:hypothetical protein
MLSTADATGRPVEAIADVFVGRVRGRGGEGFGSELVPRLEPGITGRQVNHLCRIVGRAAAVVEGVRRGVPFRRRTWTGPGSAQMVCRLEDQLRVGVRLEGVLSGLIGKGWTSLSKLSKISFLFWEKGLDLFLLTGDIVVMFEPLLDRLSPLVESPEPNRC